MVRNVLGHGAAGYAVLGQVLAGELRAVDAGGELIGIAGQLDLREALVQRFSIHGERGAAGSFLAGGRGRTGSADGAEVDHDGRID